jgi:hypothetical protein
MKKPDAKKHIRLTKIKASENPEYATPHWNSYKQGVVNKGTSIPIDYWVEGFLINPLKVGESAMIQRTVRNGVEVSGFMTTSEIIEINGDIFETLNSIYKIEYLDK